MCSTSLTYTLQNMATIKNWWLVFYLITGLLQVYQYATLLNPKVDTLLCATTAAPIQLYHSPRKKILVFKLLKHEPYLPAHCLWYYHDCKLINHWFFTFWLEMQYQIDFIYHNVSRSSTTEPCLALLTKLNKPMTRALYEVTCFTWLTVMFDLLQSAYDIIMNQLYCFIHHVGAYNTQTNNVCVSQCVSWYKFTLHNIVAPLISRLGFTEKYGRIYWKLLINLTGAIIRKYITHVYLHHNKW